MNEATIEDKKATGMCVHGNFPSSCKKCMQEGSPSDTQEVQGGTEDEPIRFQERDPFDDFLEHIDREGVRRLPTPEEREKMDRSIRALGELFQGSGVRWQLDGAINISLITGDYIGIHKDVDISLDADELEQVEKHLVSRGYAFFLSGLKDPSQPRGKKVMERVSAKKFLEAAQRDDATQHPMIARVDKRGVIQEGDDLNFIDTHIVRKDEEGKPVGWGGVSVPGKWYEPYPVVVHGVEISTSHPAKVAYFKIHGDRAYDQMDLRPLAQGGHLTHEDIDEIRGLVRQEMGFKLKKAEPIFGRILGGMDGAMNPQEVASVFEADPFIAPRMNETLKAQIMELAEIIVAEKKWTFQDLQDDVVRIFKVHEQEQKMMEKIDQVEGWIPE